MAKKEFGLERQVKVSARAYAAVMLAQSTEETRYYLNGVMIEPCAAGGVLLVATNGHILIAVHDKDGEANGKWICPVPAQMRRFLLANLEPRAEPEDFDGFYLDEEDEGSAGAVMKRPLDRISFDGHMASIVAPEFAFKEKSPLETVMAATAQAIDGTFPYWPKVLPRPTAATPALADFTLAARYMMEINRAVRIWNDCLNTGIRIRAVEPNGPVLLGAFEKTDMLIVLMPMRDDHAPLAIPDWVPEPVTEPA